MKLGILASHNGSNLQAIIDAIEKGVLPASVSVIISNNSASGAAGRAKKHSIPFYHLSGKTHPVPVLLDKQICSVLEKHDVDIVFLAGYMKLLGPIVLNTYQNRILNTHPALLPDFGGKGMYGINVHRAVIKAGASETGITVHKVDAEYDTGEIVAQKSVPVLKNDTAESLAERVLKNEHEFVVETLALIAGGNIKINL